jgi:hypothetical protein
MLEPLFFAVEVARKHLNKMLDAAKIRVCTVVNTDAAGCLLVDDTAVPPVWLRKKNH